jgi:hypothetical protein
LHRRLKEVTTKRFSLDEQGYLSDHQQRTWFKEQLWWMMMVNNWHEWEWDRNGEWLRSGLRLENGMLASCGALWQEILNDRDRLNPDLFLE